MPDFLRNALEMVGLKKSRYEIAKNNQAILDEVGPLIDQYYNRIFEKSKKYPGLYDEKLAKIEELRQIYLEKVKLNQYYLKAYGPLETDALAVTPPQSLQPSPLEEQTLPVSASQELPAQTTLLPEVYGVPEGFTTVPVESLRRPLGENLQAEALQYRLDQMRQAEAEQQRIAEMQQNIPFPPGMEETAMQPIPTIEPGKTQKDIGTFWREFQKEPERLMPFIGSGKKVTELWDTYKALQKVKEGTATAADVYRVEQYVKKLSAEMGYDPNQPATYGYDILNLISDLPAFFAELAMTSGFYSLGKTAIRKNAEALAKKYLQESSEEFLKKKGVDLATKIGGGILGSTLQTLPSGVARIPKGIIQNAMPEIKTKSAYYSERSKELGPVAERLSDIANQIEEEFQTLSELEESLDPNNPEDVKRFNNILQRYNKLLTDYEKEESNFALLQRSIKEDFDKADRYNIGVIIGDGQPLPKSIVKAVGDQWIEVLSEHSGGLFNEGAKALGKLSIVKAILKNNPHLPKHELVGRIREVVEKIGWHGLVNEMLEERAGEVGRWVVGLEDYKPPSTQQLLVELVGFSVPGVTIHSVNEVLGKLEERREDQEAKDYGTYLADVYQGTQYQRMRQEFAKIKRIKKGIEKGEKRREAGTVENVLYAKPIDYLTPVERKAVDLGIPIVRKDGTPYSSVYINRKVRAKEALIKAEERKKEPKTITYVEEDDPLYKPIHLLTEADKGELARMVADMVDRGYDVDKINALGLKGVQKLLRGDLDEFQFRKFVRPPSEEAEGQKQITIEEEKPEQIIEQEKPVRKLEVKTFTLQEGTPDAIRYGLTENINVADTRAKIRELSQAIAEEYKKDDPDLRKVQEMTHNSQMLTEALSAKLGRYITFQKGKFKSGYYPSYFREKVESIKKELKENAIGLREDQGQTLPEVPETRRETGKLPEEGETIRGEDMEQPPSTESGISQKERLTETLRNGVIAAKENGDSFDTYARRLKAKGFDDAVIAEAQKIWNETESKPAPEQTPETQQEKVEPLTETIESENFVLRPPDLHPKKPTAKKVVSNRQGFFGLLKDGSFTNSEWALKAKYVPDELKKALEAHENKRNIDKTVEDLVIKGESFPLTYIGVFEYRVPTVILYDNKNNRFGFLDKKYYDYFVKTLGPDVRFEMISPESAFFIYKGEELAGLVMPIKVKNDDLKELANSIFTKKQTGQPAKAAGYFNDKDIELVTKQLIIEKSFAEIKEELERNGNKEYSDNDVQEMIEYAIQQYARKRLSELSSYNKTDEIEWNNITFVYDKQPNLSRRTSTKKINQQYSTPLPLAWLMGKLVAVSPEDKVFDPTAGTGMLSINADLKNFYANEIDPKRLELLNKMLNADNVTDIDVLLDEFDKEYKDNSFDVVLMNPPFGVMDKSRKFDLLNTKKLDHYIALVALQKMKNNGRAAILIGGNAFKNNFGKPVEELGESYRIFFNYLYSRYNVVAHINIDGKLYKKMGTEYPTQLIVVDGRKKTPSDYVPLKKEDIIETKSYDDLYNLLEKRGKDGLLRTGERTSPRGRAGVGSTGEQYQAQPPGIRGGVQGETSPIVGQSGPVPGGTNIGVPVETTGVGTVERGTERSDYGRRRSGVSAPEGKTETAETGKPKPPETTLPGKQTERPGPRPVIKEGYGVGNKLVSRDRAQELAEAIKKKLSQKQTPPKGYASSFDSELYSMGVEMAVFHLEAGNKKFEDYAREMIAIFGDPIIPYLKSFYIGARNYPGIDTKGMNTESEVERIIDLGGIEKIIQEMGKEKPQETKEQQFPIKQETGLELKQVPSVLGSKGRPMNTVMPRNLVDNVKDVLDEIKEKHGDIDKYVLEKLQMGSLERLHNAFGAEQIDDLALAIYQMENGYAMIIGDQAGFGKGRVVAGLIHYGILQGRVPVFVTQKANLFSDLWRDFIGIGLDKYKPAIFNANSVKTKADIYDTNGNLVHKAFDQAERAIFMDEVIEGGMGAIKGKYDFVVLTYSQVNSQDNKQQRALRKLAFDNYIIMDECHQATGEFSNTGEFFKEILYNTKGVTFLSATYAKRPANMALYYNTILGTYDLENLTQALIHGGVPLQEILAAALSKKGQYIRHERTYDGVKFEPILLTERYNEHARLADNVTEVLRDMVAFDQVLQIMIKKLNNNLKKQSRKVVQGVTIREHASRVPFASRVHNVVSQLMLSLKVDDAVNTAIAELKQNKKVILTVSNTMASILEEHILNENISVGDAIDMTFEKVLLRALDRQLTYTIVDALGNRRKERIDIEIDPVVRTMYDELKEKIANMFAGLTASPLDLIRDRIRAAGYNVDEITGRNYIVDFSDEDNPKLGLREEVNKHVLMHKFNNGELDVLIANRSSSTGVSLHSGKEFKDQRTRVMIMIQPELDINEVVQMWGRIFRTGQVNLPEYKLLFTDLPTERRPAAILTKKMQSLNANVSASQSGATKLPAINFFNKYGDAILQEMLMEMTPEERLELIGKDVTKDNVREITAMRATGWMALAPVRVQEEFFTQFEQRYNAFIRDITEKGENDLETRELDFKAKTITRTRVFIGQDNNNPLLSDAYIEEVEANVLTKPLSREDVQKRLNQKPGIYLAEFHDKLKVSADEYYNKIIAKYENLMQTLKKEYDELNKKQEYKKANKVYEDYRKYEQMIFELQTEKEERLAIIEKTIHDLPIGKHVTIVENEDYEDTAESYRRSRHITGVLIDVYVGRKESGSPIALSNIHLRFATNDRSRHFITIPLSKLQHGYGDLSISKPEERLRGQSPFELILEGNGIPDTWESTKAKQDREVVRIWTGNVLVGVMQGHLGKGQSIIRYTTEDGRIKEGILLKQETIDSRHLIETNDYDTVLQYLKTSGNPVIRPNNDQNVVITWDGKQFLITVPITKKEGEKYYRNKKLLAIIENGEMRQENYVNANNHVTKGFVGKILQNKEALFANLLNEYSFVFSLPRSFLEKYADLGPKAYGFADLGGYSGASPAFIEMPELVELLEMINKGKLPKIVEKVGRQAGVLGRFKPGTRSIELGADIFANTDLALKVMAHEIGHLIDYLPDEHIKRGNILARMATLKFSMQSVYNNMYRNSEIRNELKTLTQIWKPFDPAKDKKYTKYRYSAPELYADAISVLFNNPDLLKHIAPRFYKGFFEYFDRKVEVKEAYDAIQKRINMGYAEIQEARYERRRAAFEHVEQTVRGMEDDFREIKEDLWQTLGRLFIDKNYKVISLKKRALKRQAVIDPQDDPVYWLEELPYISSEVFQYLRDINNEIKKKLDAYGLTEADLGDYLFLNRAATEREKLANPWGYSKKQAEEGLEWLKVKLGSPEKFAQLEKLIQRFREIRNKTVRSLMEKAEMYSDDLMDVIKNNENYATFAVEEYLQNRYGGRPTAYIHRQIGTLKAIKNPFTATILKDAAIIRAANRKMAAEKLVAFLEQHFPDEIRKAERRWVTNHWEYLDPKDPNLGLIQYLHKGKMVGYYVDKYVAKIFNNDPYMSNRLINIYDNCYTFLKDVFVGKNPFWAIWNSQRDFRSMVLKTPGINIFAVVRDVLSAVPDTIKDVFLGESTDIVRDLYEQKALIVGRYWRAKVQDDYTEFERMLEHMTIHPKSHRSIVHKAFSSVLEALELPGRFSERLFKIAGAKRLRKLGYTGKQWTHMVRVLMGSPDFYRRAQWTRAMNNIFMFSNAGKEGWRSNFEGFTQSKSAYAFKLILYSIVPKLLMWGGKVGVLSVFFGKIFGYDDDEMKMMWNNIPDHDMQNYQCIPIALTEDNKTVYLRFPDDFFGQVISGVLYRILTGKDKDSIMQILDYVHGEIPYSSLNPFIQASINAGAMVTNRNVYDPWRGQHVIPDDFFEAGGFYKWSYYGKYQLEQFGLSNYWRFPRGEIERDKSKIEKLTDSPVLGGLLKRFVKVSNRGMFEKLIYATKETRQQLAINRLETYKAIEKHLKDVEKPSRTDARALYSRLKAEGELDVGKFGQNFYPKYMVVALFKNNDPVIKAFNAAKTNEEKLRVLEEAFPSIKVDDAYVRAFKRELKSMYRN